MSPGRRATGWSAPGEHTAPPEGPSPAIKVPAAADVVTGDCSDRWTS
ncbi:hypothetical protein ABIE67_002929 [Streptomyces sp. V4I8]